MSEPGSFSKSVISKHSLRRWVLGVTTAFAAIGFFARANTEDSWWLSHPADPYPLVECVVCDSALDEDAEFLDIDGREIRVCGNITCGADFYDSMDRWLEEADHRMTDQQRSLYPLTTCLVSGDSLETSGAVEIVLFNRLFLLCGEDCTKTLKEDPKKYFGQLNKAVIEKQKPNYPLDKCIVSGQALDENAIDYVVANQLVRLADKEQIEAFDRMAGKYLAELRKLTKK